MKPTAVVALVGPARSGKSTLAEHWRTRYGFHIVSFADPIKEMCLAALAINPAPLEVVYWPGKPPDDPSRIDWHELLYVHRTPFTRWLLQFIGTDIVRERVMRDYWAVRGMRRIETLLAKSSVVIPDLRFANEAAIIRAFGGDIIRVERKESPAIEHGLYHASEIEAELIEEDHLIENNGTIEEFCAEADKMLNFESIH